MLYLPCDWRVQYCKAWTVTFGAKSRVATFTHRA